MCACKSVYMYCSYNDNMHAVNNYVHKLTKIL